MKRVALIVNPFASSVTEERVRAVERELAAAAAVETVRTEKPGHATALVEAAGDVDAVVVFSGDGGFNEAVNGADGRVPLGFVPGGHTNVLPRALGLPRDPVSVARLLAAALETGNTRRISLGRVNGRRFSFGAGIGLDAELVRRVEARGRGADGGRAGDLVFAWTAVRVLAERRGRFEPALEVEGLGRAAFALVANADPYTYAGRVPLRVAPAARFESGLDVVAPRRVRPQMLPRLLAYAVRGRGQEDARDVLYGHDLDRIRIVCDAPLPLQADGEDLGDVTEAVFECEREALAVLR
jgi:diacylglycerol kinase family enzyme